MKNIIGFLTKHSFPAIMLAAVTSVAIVTFASSTIKVAGSMSGFKPKVPEVKTVQAALQEESNLTVKTSDDKKPEATPSPTISPATPKPTVKPVLALNTGSSTTTNAAVNTGGTVTSGIKPSVSVNTTGGNKVSTAVISPSVTGSGSSNSTPTNSGGCIITLFGKQYDVSSLMNTHSGGNVFQCGADQTALYQSTHGMDVGRMQPYLVNSATASSGSSSSGGSSGSVGSSVSGNTSGANLGTNVSTGTRIQIDDDTESNLEESELEQHSEIEDKEIQESGD